MGDTVVLDIIGDLSLTYVDLGSEKIEELCGKMNDYLGVVDYRIANLESPIVLKESANPIIKSGPNLKMTSEKGSFIKNINIDGYILANNHLGDFGEEGIEDTIQFLNDLNREYVGSSLRIQDTYKPLRKTIKGINLSVIAVCENEFGTMKKDRLGAAGYDEEIVEKLIKQEKQWADYIFVIYHGGSEFYPFPLPGQKRRFHHFADWGADYIISMHSHCPVGYEEYNNGKIYYGTGNFFFPQNKATIYESWGYGYVVRIHLKKNSSKEELIPYHFNENGNEFVLVDENRFQSYFKLISEPITNDDRLRELCDAWLEIRKGAYANMLKIGMQEPVDKKKQAIMRNIFACEAHNELMGCLFSKLYEYGETKNLELIDEIKKCMRIKDFLEDNKKEKKQKTVAIWGVCRRGEKVYESLKSDEVKTVFIDSNIAKFGYRLYDCEIISPDKISLLQKDTVFYICTAPKWHDEIKKELMEKGITAENIIFPEIIGD